eukprot:TsM_001236300 transcript=TsM_001236300 gene=TsM_001236300
MFALYPLLITFVDRHRTEWLKQPTVETDRLVSTVANLSLIWMALRKASIKRLLPIGIRFFRFISPLIPMHLLLTTIHSAYRHLRRNEHHEVEVDITEYLRYALDKDDELSAIRSETKTCRWQELLYRKIDRMIALSRCHDALGVSTKVEIINRIMTLAKVMHALYLFSHVVPTILNRGAWKKLDSTQRKRAAMACFRMQPFYAQPRHRAITHFPIAYHDGWLSHEESLGVWLIEEITGASPEEQISSAANAPVPTPLLRWPIPVILTMLEVVLLMLHR